MPAGEHAAPAARLPEKLIGRACGHETNVDKNSRACLSYHNLFGEQARSLSKAVKMGLMVTQLGLLWKTKAPARIRVKRLNESFRNQESAGKINISPK